MTSALTAACSLAQEFEKTLDGWMAEFHTLLTYDNPALAETDPERESAAEAVKAAVCQNINLFMEARTLSLRNSCACESMQMQLTPTTSAWPGPWVPSANPLMFYQPNYFGKLSPFFKCVPSFHLL